MTLAVLALLTYSAATNFSVDILGEPDHRPGTWGRAGYHIFSMTFRPPPDHRVRILRVYGDFLIWPRGKPPEGTFAGALLGLQTTAPEGSVRVDYGADNTFFYIQTATHGEPARAAFDAVVREGGLLERDHVLRVKVAVWLNDTELVIHCEPTFVVVYRFERDRQ